MTEMNISPVTKKIRYGVTHIRIVLSERGNKLECPSDYGMLLVREQNAPLAGWRVNRILEHAEACLSAILCVLPELEEPVGCRKSRPTLEFFSYRYTDVLVSYGPRRRAGGFELFLRKCIVDRGQKHPTACAIRKRLVERIDIMEYRMKRVGVVPVPLAAGYAVHAALL